MQKITKQNVRTHFLNGTIRLYAADMLQPDTALPQGADAIWMSQFLDCFSEEQIVTILKKCRHAMPGENNGIYS